MWRQSLEMKKQIAIIAASVLLVTLLSACSEHEEKYRKRIPVHLSPM